MRLMLNDGESVTIQCNHVLSGDQVMAHSFTFSNHGGELCGREFNAAQKNGEAPETIDNTSSDAIVELEWVLKSLKAKSSLCVLTLEIEKLNAVLQQQHTCK